MSSMREHALAYAAMGYYVFPCRPGGKEPLTPNGHTDATNDCDTVTAWWSTLPDANIGLAVKPSGLMVIDLDRHPGKPDGVELFKTLQGEKRFDVEPPQGITGGNGRHIIFKAPSFKPPGKLGPGIDIKTDGYIIVPPSMHPSGNEYTWQAGLSLLEIDPPDCPEWLLRHLRPKKSSKVDVTPKPQKQEYPDSHAHRVIERCAFMQHVRDDAASLPEPDWYHGIGVLVYTQESPEIIHDVSHPYPGYDMEHTQAKADHWLRDAKGPPTCRTIQGACGHAYCKACPYNGIIKSPIVLGHQTPQVVESSETVTAFPLDVFPEPLQKFVNETAESLQCPVDYVACALLAATSILMGGNWQIQLSPNWVQSANLWLALVGSPSSKKTPALDNVLPYVRLFEEKLNQAYQREKVQYEMAQRQYEVQLKEWRANPENDPPIKPNPPILKRLTTGDATVEALGELLANNPQGIGLLCDELSAWLRGMNQYKGGKGGDRSHYLAMWSGTPFTIDRKGKEPVVVTSPYISIIGNIQPDLLRELYSYGAHDGMTERILFCCPHPNIDPPKLSQGVSRTAETALIECLNYIYATRPDRKTKVHLDIGAEDTFLEIRDKYYVYKQSEDFPAELEAYYVKMEGQVGRLALVLHQLKQAVNGIRSNVITEEIMEAAARLGDYFLAHVRIAMGLVNKTAEQQRVERAAEWIRKKGLKVVKPRQIQTHKVAGCKTASQATALLATIADYGHGYWCSDSQCFLPFWD